MVNDAVASWVDSLSGASRETDDATTSRLPDRGGPQPAALIPVLTKTCKGCGATKPIEQFSESKTNRDGRRLFCRVCHLIQQKRFYLEHPERRAEVQKRWKKNHPETVQYHNKKHRLKVLQSRPPAPLCPNWHDPSLTVWRKGHWVCGGCTKMSAKAVARAKEIDYYRMQVFKRHGSTCAKSYMDIMRSNPSAKAQVKIERILRRCLPPDYRNLSDNQILRLMDINRASKLPSNNIGWACSLCGIFSVDFRFFDVDHIHPKAAGGRRIKDNLHVLCPNCHRIKTLSDRAVGLNGKSDASSVHGRSRPFRAEQGTLNIAPHDPLSPADRPPAGRAGGVGRNAPPLPGDSAESAALPHGSQPTTPTASTAVQDSCLTASPATVVAATPEPTAVGLTATA